MASVTPVIPSGSTNGKPIKIAATATLGTTFHTAASGTSTFDAVTMYLSNTDTAERSVTVEFGGATSPDNQLKFKVAAGQTMLAIPGIRLQNGLAVTVFADAANVVTMSGNVDRYA